MTNRRELADRLEGMVRKVRYFLLKKIAGREHIAINLVMGENGALLTIPAEQRALVSNCCFKTGQPVDHFIHLLDDEGKGGET